MTEQGPPTKAAEQDSPPKAVTTRTIAAGTYKIRNKKTGTVLDVQGSNVQDQYAIIAADSSGSTSQKWIRNEKNGLYAFSNTVNKTLFIGYDSPNAGIGLQLVTEAAGGNNRFFTALDGGNGTTILQVSHHLVVDLQADSGDDTLAILSKHDCGCDKSCTCGKRSSTQEWVFESI